MKVSQLFDFIKEYTFENGYSPTYLEMKDFFNIKSTSYLCIRLDILELTGQIERNGTAKSIRVLVNGKYYPDTISRIRRRPLLPEEVLSFVKEYIKENNYSPRFSDICDGVDIRSNETVCKIITLLENNGLITRMPKKWRSIRVVKWT